MAMAMARPPLRFKDKHDGISPLHAITGCWFASQQPLRVLLSISKFVSSLGGIVTTGVRLESDTQGSDTRSRVQVGGVYVMYLYTILNDKSCLSFHHNQTQRQRTLPAVRRQSESCVECVWTKQVGMCVMSEIYP